MIPTKCQNMLRWSGQNANQKFGADKMPTTEKSPDIMPTFGWHYVRLAFCPVGILSYHPIQLDTEHAIITHKHEVLIKKEIYLLLKTSDKWLT